ncbi:uncharacterized protein Bfra_007716 [Botrytis fragariae]|uniref:Uncharacterized protein n=1 Tax=Botrytis fragariae TaxID=1964551 RepID=A0A8H6EGE1_9HELO|nr:uncharacterized protein Bfra_007716 [Botrytis fragariae]KAF5871203.1 hypothetical protein Bfra_007716 [Botrytis fragariae]
MVPRYKGSATSRSSDQELKEKTGQVWFILVNSLEFMPMLANFTDLNLLNIMGSMDGRIDHVSHSHFVNENIETLTKAYKIGNVILFHKSVSTTMRLIRSTAPLQDLVENYGNSRNSLSQLIRVIREIGEWLALTRLLQHNFLVRWLLVRPVISQMHLKLPNCYQ